MKDKKCDFIIYVRDLDGFLSEVRKFREKQNWFQKLESKIDSKGLFLLNIWELEALIFADIETFSNLYKISYEYNGDPMVIKEPKEKLKEITNKSRNKFKASHCPDIFKKLDFDKVRRNCSYFQNFILEFEKKLV